METPSSTRMVTRSQVGKNSVPTSSKESRQRKTGQALIDITNDSPIVGLTSGSLKTPLTSATKGMSTRKVTMTPGSGEALLRGQVKNLLQMVEEETELHKHQQLPCRPFVGIYRALTDSSFSPITLLAPANTPQILSSSGDQKIGFKLPSPIIQDPIFISQGERKEESLEAKSPLTRSLMLEFLEKDESECHSTVTNREAVESDGGSNGKSVLVGDDDVDDSSTWSMRVNASTEDEYEYEDVGDEVVYIDEDYEYSDHNGADADELCSEMSSLSVNGGSTLPMFTGKHIRFEYNSDEDEPTDN